LEFLIGLEWTGVDWSGQIKGFRGLVGSWSWVVGTIQK
jgi:hypothetical protein